MKLEHQQAYAQICRDCPYNDANGEVPFDKLFEASDWTRENWYAYVATLPESEQADIHAAESVSYQKMQNDVFA